MDELIEMLSGLRIWVGPMNHVLDGGSDAPMGRGNFKEEMAGSLQSIVTLCCDLFKNS